MEINIVLSPVQERLFRSVATRLGVPIASVAELALVAFEPMAEVLDKLPPRLDQPPSAPVPSTSGAMGQDFRVPANDLVPLDELESRYVRFVLTLAERNRSRAAEVLGVDRRTLYRMAERYGFPLAGNNDE